MIEVVIFRRTQTFEARDHYPERRVLLFSRLNGDDITATATDEVFELAQELPPIQPMIVGLEIETMYYNGNGARLRCVALKTPDGAAAGDDLPPSKGTEKRRTAELERQLADLASRLP
jgi:hypothetical protein